MFAHTKIVNLCQNSVFQNCRDVENEVFEKKLHFSFQEKQKKKKNKMEKAPTTVKIVFVRWLSKNEKNGQNGF